MGNKLDNLLVKPCHPHGQNQSRRFSDSRHQYQQPAYNQQHGQSQHHQKGSLIRQQQQKVTQHHQYYDHQALSYVPEKPPKRNSSFSFSRRKGKLNSCPDLLKGAEPYYYGGNASGLSYGLKEYKSDSSEKTVDIKIYRSYTDLPTDTQQPLKIKVYRKSQESLVNVGRVQSLPKGINRTDSSEFSNSIESRLSVAATAQELTRPPSRRSSSRCSNVSSTAANCRTSINVDDFPNVDTVKKKLSVFEQFFANLVLKYFKNLTLLDQLSCICVAVMPDRANQSVSLLHYFQSNDIPDDLGRSDIALQLQRRESESDPPNILPLYPTLPDFLLDEIREVKFITLPDEQAAVCQDLASKIIAYLAREAAIELGRIYEYQLSLIQETIAFRLLAKYAATNVFEAVKNRGKLLDKNTIISSAIMQWSKRGSTISGSTAASDYGSSAASPKWVSVISFSKELKWNIYDIFRKSALRKDLFVPDSPTDYAGSRFAHSPSFSPPILRRPGSGSLLPQTPVSFVTSDRKSFEPENSPWKFYASSDSDPMLYGYRSQAVEWDFVRRRYRLSSSDESRFVEELPWRYDDVHRLYCPYFRIFSDLHLSAYCDWVKSFGDARAAQSMYEESVASSRSGSDSLRPTARGFKEYTRQFRSGIHVREDCKLIYRNVAGYEQHSSRRSDVLALRNAIISGDADSLGSSRCATEVTSTPEFTNRRSAGFSGRPSSASCVTSAENGGQGDVESLRRAIAQVTMDCDQLCFNLKDMESE